MSHRKIYRIKLTAEERSTFEDIIKGKRGKVKIAAWKVQRANAMLKCDESEQGPAWADEKIADAFATTTRSLENWLWKTGGRKRHWKAPYRCLSERSVRRHQRHQFLMVRKKHS